MGTEVIHTVGAGKTYSTFAAWEAAQQRDLVSAGEDAVAEIYGTLSENINVQGWTTDASNRVVIRAAPGQEYDPALGTGATISGTASYAPVHTIWAVCRIQNMRIIGDGTANRTVSANNLKVHRSLLRSEGSQAEVLSMAGGHDIRCWSSRLEAVESNSEIDICESYAATTFLALNCILLGSVNTTASSASGWRVIDNSYLSSLVTNLSNLNTAGCNNNASKVNQLIGTASLSNVADSAFLSTASYLIDEASVLFDAGGVTSDKWDIFDSTDIYGTAWPGEADRSIGYHHPYSGTNSTGSISGNIDAITSSVSGNITHIGSLSSTLAGTVAEITGSVEIAGSITAVLDTLSANISGTLVSYGTITSYVESISSSISGLSEKEGTLSGTVDSIEGNIVGSVTHHGQVAATVNAIVATMSGTVESTGDIVATVVDVTADITCIVAGGGTLAATVNDVVSSIHAAVSHSGSIAASVDSITASFNSAAGNECCPLSPSDIDAIVSAMRSAQFLTLGQFLALK